ncbi:dienelactone hydrolase family protein [Granulicella sibirica]|uniref:Putative 1: dienelactone hydrolase n=1 Tax=Granulicella sibirica TaxID=2479048 RepID=A0A4Q0T1P0_9BACT|nr:dienelactone hydrolase family protein [Granulicella sibirica]RXH55819.1 putative 1: dienelactone hydrolase [Granulicella sibirica]
MIITNGDYVDLETPNGLMRTHILKPAAPGRYPAILLYSEIFQVTAPIRRTAAMLAGHGFIVAVPEIYHEFVPAGEIFPYDQAGSDRGNALKTTKTIAGYDADSRAVVDHFLSRPDCNGKIGVMGICIGGHLAFRAAFNPEVLGTVCFYATDLHKATLGAGMHDDSLVRTEDIKGELFMVWGRQDPHVSLEGRTAIQARLNQAGTRMSWIEVNGAHAFLRDEGIRYDPDLAHSMMQLVFNFFHRRLSEGDHAV